MNHFESNNFESNNSESNNFESRISDIILSGKGKEALQIYRRRIIPDECILLKDDIILDITPDYILTEWKALKPGRELHHGMSCYYLNQGIKVSKFCREDDTIMYWYCDIVDHQYDPDKHTLVVTDLLADVIIYPDGRLDIVDLDEVADVLESGLLPSHRLAGALRCLDRLLVNVRTGQFSKMYAPMV